MREIAAAVVMCAIGGAAAPAQEPAVGPFALPATTRPAESGKPFNFGRPAPAASSPSGGCAAWDCRFRVIGAAPRDGAIELSARLLRW